MVTRMKIIMPFLSLLVITILFPQKYSPKEVHKELQSSRNKTIKSFVLSSAVNNVSCRELFDR